MFVQTFSSLNEKVLSTCLSLYSPKVHAELGVFHNDSGGVRIGWGRGTLKLNFNAESGRLMVCSVPQYHLYVSSIPNCKNGRVGDNS